MGRIVKRAFEPATGRTRPLEDGDYAAWSFGAYVPHPCAQWIPSLSPAAADALDEAGAALRAVSADPQAAAARWVLSRVESAASSIIEHVHPHPRRMLIAEAVKAPAAAPSGDDRETLRNIAATRHALRIGDTGSPVSVADICTVHAVLMGDDPIAGRLRTAQNWIGGRFSTPIDAVYVPPPAEEVPALMEDLAACVNRRGVDPVMQAAIVHAQFETIHPFADGNGRTGRALIHLVLRRGGICRDTVLPISATLAARRGGYIGGLDACRAHCEPFDEGRSTAMSSWVEFFARAAVQAAVSARNTGEAVAALQQRWHDALHAAPRRSPAARRLVDALAGRPLIDTNTAAELAGCDQRTALRCLDLLRGAEVLEQVTDGRRNRVYVAAGILEAVDQRLRPLI